MLSITVDDLKYLLSFAIFLLVAVITGTMANRLRNQAEIARRRETRTSALYALSRKIVAETELDGILKTVVSVVSDTINGEAAIFLPDKNGELIIKAINTIPNSILLNKEETIAARWVYKHGQIAGNGTETLVQAKGLYFPLRIEEKNLGVLAVRPSHPDQNLSTEHRQLIEAFANLTALAVLSLQLTAEAQQARYLTQSEKLRTALFNSISHELRTPLASIMGAVTSLLEEGDIYNQSDRKTLLQTVNEATLRMNRLVGNLLDMARLESGMMQLKSEWCDIQEIIGVALRRMQDLLQQRPVHTDIPVDLSLVKADFALIEQVLVNLLDNALKYSPPDTEIAITVEEIDKEIQIAVQNKGDSIPKTDDQPVLTFGDLTVDLAHRQVIVEGREVKLTPTEYDILKNLALHAGRVLTHRQLLRTIWGADYQDEAHYLRVYIGQLRRKIEPDPTRPKYIITEPGVGYRLVYGE
ncbi:MAG: Osmosensitive channel His kinase sensor [Peptococcaceae bacterium]|nr:Osmosensitive channel His kinase sensor [Peptococcaceae bacterium]